MKSWIQKTQEMYDGADRNNLTVSYLSGLLNTQKDIFNAMYLL